MTITLNGTTGITTPAVTNNGAYTGDGISFADGTPSNTLVTDTSGNVGIGTSSPYNNAAFNSLSIGGSKVGFIGLNNASGTMQATIDTYNNQFRIGTNGTTNPIVFNTGGSVTEAMRIDFGGTLLVGSSSGVSGYRFTLTHSDTGGMAYVYNGTSEQNSCSFRNANGQVGRIYTSGSNTTYSTSSDYRLKDNIAPMTGALDKVAQLKPCTYTWKVDGSAGQGFIAHELQAVVPDCVGGVKDGVDEEGNPVYQDIDTSFLVATLTAAIQEQQAIITDLKARIETLENK